MKRVTILVLAFIIKTSCSFSQNLHNIKDCTVLINYSDVAKEKYQLIPTNKEIIDIFKYEVSDIKYNDVIPADYTRYATIIISIDLFIGDQANNNEEYFGEITFKVWRDFIDTKISSEKIPGSVFNDEVYFIYNNSNYKIYSDIKQLIRSLILAFGKEYYKDN